MNLQNKAIDMAGADYRGIHPAVVLFSWLFMLVMLHFIDGYRLLLFAFVFSVYAYAKCPARFVALVRRSRWLLLSIAIIYAYTGSGERLWPQFGIMSPLLEGGAAGVVQMLRLLVMLSSLALLLERLKLGGVMLALDTMLRPLNVLGIRVERGLLRLALTLAYAEQGNATANAGWGELIGGKMHNYRDPVLQIEIGRLPFARHDWIFLGISIGFLSWVAW